MKSHDNIRSAIAALPALLFAGYLSACEVEAEGITGDTGCYSASSGGVNVSGGTVTVQGMTASMKDPAPADCPKFKKVEVTIFNDGNGNGKQDGGETSVESSNACSAVGVTSMTTGSFSFNKDGASGGNAYSVKITDENGENHGFGGNF